MLLKLRNNANFFADISAVFGIFLIGAQLWNDSHSEKIRTSLSYEAALRTDKFINLRFALIEPWLQYDLDQHSELKLSQKAFVKLVINIVDEDRGVFEALYETNIFFHSLNNCIDLGACDPETAYRQFGDLADQVIKLYAQSFPYMQDRVALDNFGQAMIEFSSVR